MKEIVDPMWMIKRVGMSVQELLDEKKRHEAEIKRLRYFELNMDMIEANINNEKLTDAQFREFMRNSFLKERIGYAPARSHCNGIDTV
jgi:hypothetical protein